MKKSIILLFLITSIVGCTPKNHLSIISFNVRNCESADGMNSWENRKNAVIKMVINENPDILCVQEAYLKQVNDIVNNCSNYDYYGVGRDNGFDKGETTTIFFKKNCFDLIDNGCFWLSPTPNTASKGWDAACVRMLTWVYLRHKLSGKEFFVMNTHLDHLGKTAQRESIQLILDEMKTINNTNLPLLLTGDFNVLPSDRIITILDMQLSDARRFAPQTDSIGTYNAWGQESDIIDYIFYSKAKALTFNTITKYFGVPYISDHYPVKIKFQL